MYGPYAGKKNQSKLIVHEKTQTLENNVFKLVVLNMFKEH